MNDRPDPTPVPDESDTIGTFQDENALESD